MIDLKANPTVYNSSKLKISSDDDFKINPSLHNLTFETKRKNSFKNNKDKQPMLKTTSFFFSHIHFPLMKDKLYFLHNPFPNDKFYSLPN